MLRKAKEKAAGLARGLNENFVASPGSSLGQVASSALDWSSSVAADKVKTLKDLVKAPKSSLVTGSLPTALVPEQHVDYAILLPPKHRGSDDDGESYPLLLTLHGLKGSRDGLVKQHEHGEWDARFASGAFPETVIATISAGDSYYMDFFDKSAMWETFLLEEFIPFVIKTCNCGASREQRYLMGGSMGGHGALKLAFRHPDKFAAVAVFEPAVDAALEPSHLCQRNHLWALAASDCAQQSLATQMWGGAAPDYDSLHYKLNNPASIADDNAASIRDSNLLIYLDVGDRDCLNLHDGTEFLHRVLWDHAIEHEYHLIHGADHVGSSLSARMAAVCAWMGTTVHDTIRPQGHQRFQLDSEEKKYLKWLSHGAAQGLPREGHPVSLESDKMIPLFRSSLPAAMRQMLGASNQGPSHLGGFRWRARGRDEAAAVTRVTGEAGAVTRAGSAGVAPGGSRISKKEQVQEEQGQRGFGPSAAWKETSGIMRVPEDDGSGGDE